MFSTLYKHSRPRFWLYTAGPFALGTIAGIHHIGGEHIQFFHIFLIVARFLYTLIAGNILIYGVNDYADWDTDTHNEKKKGYERLLNQEKKNAFLSRVLGVHGSVLLICSAFYVFFLFNTSFFPNISSSSVWIFFITVCLFIFFSVFYSLPPIRAKAHPGRDGFFQILYCIPGLYAYTLLTGEFPSFRGILAGRFRCIAMHCYSAIPDIDADTKAGLQTTATRLGYDLAMRWTMSSFLFSGVLVYRYACCTMPIFAAYCLLCSVFYAVYTFFTTRKTTKKPPDVLYRYRWFPLINAIVGMGIFFLLWLQW